MNKLRVCLFLLALLITAFAAPTESVEEGGQHEEQEMKLGGYELVSEDNKELYHKVFTFLIRSVKGLHKHCKILEIRRQVVAGYNYKALVERQKGALVRGRLSLINVSSVTAEQL